MNIITDKMTGADLINIEYDIVGAAISNRDNMFLLLEYPVDIFQMQNCRDVYQAIKTLSTEGGQVDLTNIYIELSKSVKDVNQIISELSKSNVIINFEFAVREMYNAKIKRDMMLKCFDLYSKLKSNDMGYETFISEICDLHDKIEKPHIEEIESYAEMSKLSLEELFKSSFLRTGITSIDNKIVGIFNGDLFVLAARPGMGKTSLAVQIAENINNAFVFCFEMRSRNLYARSISARAQIEAWKIKSRKMSEDEIERVIKIRENIAGKNIRISKESDFNKMMLVMRQEVKKNEPSIIIIDYLQRIAGLKGYSEHLRIAEITKTLKNFALDHDIPIILLSQLSRANDKENREPQLSDLRDSGAIEADADEVMFLHENKDKQFMLIIAKNRDGRTGKIETMRFVKQFTYFEDEQDLKNYDDRVDIFG